VRRLHSLPFQRIGQLAESGPAFEPLEQFPDQLRFLRMMVDAARQKAERARSAVWFPGFGGLLDLSAMPLALDLDLMPGDTGHDVGGEPSGRRITNRDSPETIRLLTTLVDHEECPATQLAALYAERWEFEIGLDEIETHQIANSRVLRSKKPELVEQEIWALLLTHYAIRHLMQEAAEDVGIDEDRLSFIRSLRVVRRTVVNDADFPP
jgi:IS4 transposase